MPRGASLAAQLCSLPSKFLNRCAAFFFSSAWCASPSMKSAVRKMCVKVGCTVLFIHARRESACARSQDSLGSRPALGKLRSRKSQMATIWLRGLPSTTSTGTWPFGLIARYSGDFCSPLCSFTIFGSKSWPLAALIASRATCGTNEQAPGAK